MSRSEVHYMQARLTYYFVYYTMLYVRYDIVIIISCTFTCASQALADL